jgi:hypothetical protein
MTRSTAIWTLLVAGLLLAGGLASAPASRGESQTIEVPMTVPPTVSLDASGCMTLASVSATRFNSTTTIGPCSVSFASNSPTGAQLLVADANTGQPGLRTNDGELIPAAPMSGRVALFEHEYGLCLAAVTGATAASSSGWTLGCGLWYGPVADDAVAAQTNGPGSGAAVLQLGVNPSVATVPGSYSTTIQFTVVAT